MTQTLSLFPWGGLQLRVLQGGDPVAMGPGVALSRCRCPLCPGKRGVSGGV